MDRERENVIDTAQDFIKQIKSITNDESEMAPLLTAISVVAGEVLVRAAKEENVPYDVLRERMITTLDMSIARGKRLFANEN